MTGLFRTEAVDAQRTRRLGTISLSQPLAVWLLGFASILAAAATISFVMFTDYTRRSRVGGELVPDLGLATVVASSAGVVGPLHAEEGDQVESGSPLTIIHMPRATATGNDAHVVMLDRLGARRESTEQLQKAQEGQFVAQSIGNSRQRQALLTELKQIEQEAETRREQIRIGESIVDRYRKVADERYVSLVQLSQQEQSVLEVRNSQLALERQATSLKRSIAALDQRTSELKHERQLSIASASRDMATLAQEGIELETNGALLHRAPVPGLVSSKFVQSGQSVQTGQPLYSILPKGSLLRAQLMVPSAAIGFIRPGDRVTLRYQSFPYQKFGTHGGHVLRISRSSVSSPAAGNTGGEALYRVVVELDSQYVTAYGRGENLRPGMRLEADILGERRRLYEWILEPIYSVTGRVGS